LECILCHGKADWFCNYFKKQVHFYKCSNCKSIFKDNSVFPDLTSEKLRYLTHNNNVEDENYQAFVSPITNAVVKHFSEDKIGLDYGCGTGPVAAHVLKLKGYEIVLYDPFFYPDENYDQQKYDFIICCEVMEHFHKPDKEFRLLKSLLKEEGRLYCKTSQISDHISVQEFKDWHYKNDPTHVFFYTPSALEYIKTNMGFRSLNFDKKLITFNA
jgi:2-polyprenyl-3-methyl-5-hydroxy-6-metoxy-1,4-benzoquinol methylase